MDLPGVFGTVAPFVTDYGYAAIALLVLLENLGLIVPGEAVLVTAGLFAGAGRLSLAGVALVAFAAATVGASLAYAVGRFGGRLLVLRAGRRVGITAARLDRVERFYARRGVAVVVAARFLPVLRHANGLAAGTSLMTWPRFLAGNVAGAAVWVSAWTAAGRAGSDHLDGIARVLSAGRPLAIGVAAALVAAVLTVAVRRRVRRRHLAIEEPT